MNPVKTQIMQLGFRQQRQKVDVNDIYLYIYIYIYIDIYACDSRWSQRHGTGVVIYDAYSCR